jgi:NAD(P)H-hydrate epimerase
MKVAAEIVRMMEIPVLIDADALQPEIVRSGKVAHVLTPHAGEFKRISEGLDPRALAKAAHGVVVLKGPVTKITDGGDVYHSLAGGPVLSRGGSGDLLAGLTGGLLAQTPADPLLAAARGVAWHGRAADKLAEACGQTSVRTSQLLDFLGPALRE